MPGGTKPAAREPFKELFNAVAVQRLGAAVAAAWPPFDVGRFVQDVVPDLPALELLARVDRIAQGLRDHLPRDYAAALDVVLRMAAADPNAPDGGAGEFSWLPMVRFVGAHGRGHYAASVDALRILTRKCSAEFDIRPYLVDRPEQTLARLRDFARDPDARVRRLVSEGTRPRLPWGTRLPAFIRDPSPVLDLLELLRDDPDEAVRRSVANNLNDIAKDHPDRVVSVLRRWLEGATPARERLARHALRTLVKHGHPEALALRDFTGDAVVEAMQLQVDTPTVALGGALGFQVTLRSDRDATLSIDYAVHHRKADGRRSPKVFKFAVRRVRAGEPVTLRRRHAIRPITTRRYYAGLHRLEVLVNGLSVGVRDFELVLPGPTPEAPAP